VTRRICVFTATRAEYGLLRPVVAELVADPGVEVRLLVAGTHLATGHGDTVREVEADALAPFERVEHVLASDTPVGVATSMGLGLIGVAGALDRLAPDLLVVLGDRYEALAAAAAAHLARVPVAHLHGGESTAGAADDAFRHALTKLAALHLVAAEPFRRAVLALGEDPARVHVVGAPGLDALRTLEPLDRATLERDLGLALRDPVLLVAYHPATLGEPPAAGVAALLAALDRTPAATVVLTGPNADAGGGAVAERLAAWAAANAGRARLVASLGTRRWGSLLRLAAAIVGNSSSGIIEAPAVGLPTVNVGARQAGRPRAASVTDVPAEAGAITAAIAQALSPAGRARAAAAVSPYGDGRAAGRIARLLARADLAGLAVKPPPGAAEVPREPLPPGEPP